MVVVPAYPEPTTRTSVSLGSCGVLLNVLKSSSAVSQKDFVGLATGRNSDIAAQEDGKKK